MNQAVLESKQSIVKEVTEKAKAASTIVVCEYRGLTVAQLEEIRRALRKENAELCVYKNSLVERAFDEIGYADAKEVLSGPNAIIFSEDTIAGAKIAAKYSKKTDGLLAIKGGVVEGKFNNADEMKVIAKLPGRDGLISMFLSCLQAPVRSFACAVKAVADKN
ncbi:MAG: 50S ribosomal protein L10 [Bacilli bacterium]|jgi:large subunit ribosomal protein L10|nr:50S ribosomal protein L10 [Bacilli bacterium]